MEREKKSVFAGAELFLGLWHLLKTRGGLAGGCVRVNSYTLLEQQNLRKKQRK